MKLTYECTKNCTTIYDSYLITHKRDMNKAIKEIRSNTPSNFAIHTMNKRCMVGEWMIHNYFYNRGKEVYRTKDVDLEIGQPFYYKICYWLISLL